MKLFQKLLMSGFMAFLVMGLAGCGGGSSQINTLSDFSSNTDVLLTPQSYYRVDAAGTGRSLQTGVSSAISASALQIKGLDSAAYVGVPVFNTSSNVFQLAEDGIAVLDINGNVTQVTANVIQASTNVEVAVEQYYMTADTVIADKNSLYAQTVAPIQVDDKVYFLAQGASNGALYSLDLSNPGSEPTRHLFTTARGSVSPAYNPVKRELVFADETGRVYIFDVDSGTSRVSQIPARTTTNPTIHLNAPLALYTPADEAAHRIVISGDQGDVYVLRFNGELEYRLSAGEGAKVSSAVTVDNENGIVAFAVNKNPLAFSEDEVDVRVLGFGLSDGQLKWESQNLQRNVFPSLLLYESRFIAIAGKSPFATSGTALGIGALYAFNSLASGTDIAPESALAAADVELGGYALISSDGIIEFTSTGTEQDANGAFSANVERAFAYRFTASTGSSSFSKLWETNLGSGLSFDALILLRHPNEIQSRTYTVNSTDGKLYIFN